MSTLITTIALLDDDGNAHYFGPGDSVPEWAIKRITNPDVWSEIAETDDGTREDGSEGDDDGPESVIPPKSGPGSSAKAWAEYAFSLGFETDGDAEASEIREALAEAGYPVE